MSSSPNKKQQMPLEKMPTTRQHQQQQSIKDTNSSMIAKMKLKNLQEAIAKNYSPEHLAQYGIFIPGVNSSSLTSPLLPPPTTNKTEDNNNPLSSNSSQSELMNENYYRLKYDLSNSGGRGGTGEPNYHTMPKNSGTSRVFKAKKF